MMALRAVLIAALAMTLSCGPGFCDCSTTQVVLYVEDASAGGPVADVTVSSSPPVSFFCTERTDATECIANDPPFGTMTLTVGAPGFRTVTVSGDVVQPNPEAVCDCGGLSMTVPLDPL